MLAATCILTILCAWKWGDWRNWKKYHSTMIFIAMSDLLYNVLYYDRWLWKYIPVHSTNNVVLGLLATFIILPFSGLLFLSYFPETYKGLIGRIIKFIIIFLAFEIAFYLMKFIEYDRGWNLWWSLAWNIIMFPLWALHHKKPLLAYPVCIILILLMSLKFPMHIK